MGSARVALACAGQTPIGCVFYQAAEDHLYLFRLAVLPAHRRQGLGRALIEHAEQQARALGLARGMSRFQAFLEAGRIDVKGVPQPGLRRRLAATAGTRARRLRATA